MCFFAGTCEDEKPAEEIVSPKWAGKPQHSWWSRRRTAALGIVTGLWEMVTRRKWLTLLMGIAIVFVMQAANVYGHTAEARVCMGESIEDQFLPVIDSGATSYITGDLKLFPAGLRRGRPVRVRLADGRCIVANQRGTMSFDVNGERAEFRETLYHPSINKTLLSVSKLTGAGNTLTFTKEAFVVRNNATGRVTLKGEMRSGMYMVTDAARVKSKPVLIDKKDGARDQQPETKI
jgi:hypothetical protein